MQIIFVYLAYPLYSVRGVRVRCANREDSRNGGRNGGDTTQAEYFLHSAKYRVAGVFHFPGSGKLPVQQGREQADARRLLYRP